MWNCTNKYYVYSDNHCIDMPKIVKVKRLIPYTFIYFYMLQYLVLYKPVVGYHQ